MNPNTPRDGRRRGMKGQEMALIEGFRVQNYRALRDVMLGKLSNQQDGEPLTPFTVVIGKNSIGKSTLFDAFGFVADCLSQDVESACDMKQRGGFERLRSMGSNDAIRFEIYYREATGERPMTYELAIGLDETRRPFVESEVLKQRRKGQSTGGRIRFFVCTMARGWSGPERRRWRQRAVAKMAPGASRTDGSETAWYRYVGHPQGASAYQAVQGLPEGLVPLVLLP